MYMYIVPCIYMYMYMFMYMYMYQYLWWWSRVWWEREVTEAHHS